MDNQNKPIAITLLIKDGGYEQLVIPPKMLTQLAIAIRTTGAEWVATNQRALHVVGFMVTGKQTGERVIMLGKGDGDGQPKG
jgi:hypothetical protein